MLARSRAIAMRGQGIWDLAIQEYGTVEAVFLLIDDNADHLHAGLDSAVTEGQVLRIMQPAMDRDINDYYQANDLHPVTGPMIGVDGDFNSDWGDDFDNEDNESEE